MSRNPFKTPRQSRPADETCEIPPANPFESIRLLDPFASAKQAKPARAAKPAKSNPAAKSGPVARTAQPLPSANPFDSVRLLDPFAKAKAAVPVVAAKKPADAAPVAKEAEAGLAAAKPADYAPVPSSPFDSVRLLDPFAKDEAPATTAMPQQEHATTRPGPESNFIHGKRTLDPA